MLAAFCVAAIILREQDCFVIRELCEGGSLTAKAERHLAQPRGRANALRA